MPSANLLSGWPMRYERRQTRRVSTDEFIYKLKRLIFDVFTIILMVSAMKAIIFTEVTHTTPVVSIPTPTPTASPYQGR